MRDFRGVDLSKAILSGNEAIARGFLEAGGKVATAYPGTPSTEVLETLSRETRGWTDPLGKSGARGRHRRLAIGCTVHGLYETRGLERGR